MLSPMDTALIGVVALVLFGPKKLPELGKSLGQALGNFKKHLQDAQNEVKDAMDSTGCPDQGATIKPPAKAAAGGVSAEDDPKSSSG